MPALPSVSSALCKGKTLTDENSSAEAAPARAPDVVEVAVGSLAQPKHLHLSWAEPANDFMGRSTESKSRLPSRRINVALVAIFLATNSLILVSSYLFFKGRYRNLIRYGEAIPRLAGKRLPDYTPAEVRAGQTNLVLYVSPKHLMSRSVGLVRYANLLSRRYAGAGLNVTVLVRNDDAEFIKGVSQNQANYRVLFDDDGKLASRLGLKDGESGMFLFDSNGICRFSTRNPVTIEDLRQLASWDSGHLDPLDKQNIKQQVVEAEQPLGAWAVTDVRTSQQTSADKIGAGKPSLYVFVSADCSACSLREYLRKFAELKHPADGGRAGAGFDNAILVLDFNFSRADVLAVLDEFKISASCYVSNEELPAVAVEGNVITSDDRQIIAVWTDAEQVVSKILPLTTLDHMGLYSPMEDAEAPSSLRGTPVSLEEMFRSVSLSVYDVTSFGSRYYISDARANRVLVVNDKMQAEKSIGRIGSGPGELIHPGNIGVAGDGTLFVHDGGNERIERFSVNGDYLGEFPVGTYEGFGVSNAKEIYLGQPENGSLVTVYSETGERLRSFGKLKKFSEVYGRQYADKDELYRVAVNRVRLFVDRAGNVYVSFMLAPIIQKYDSTGALLFERRLEGEEIDDLTDILLNNTHFKYLSTSKDGLEARFITLDPVVEPATGNIYVLLPSGLIYVADSEGRKLSLLRPQLPNASIGLQPFVAGVGAKDEILLIPFLPKRCFRLIPPGEAIAWVPDVR